LGKAKSFCRPVDALDVALSKPDFYFLHICLNTVYSKRDMKSSPSESPPISERMGVYIHIPFCRGKCPYCDFVSHWIDRLNQDTRREILDGVRKELGLWLDRLPDLRTKPIDSVYFGGGTPSLLEPLEIQRILTAVEEAFDFRGYDLYGGPEITVECNPGSTELGALNGFREVGVNRASLGVQSFRDEKLRALGRRHDREDALRAVRHIQSAGFPSWSMDLIYGAPGDRLSDWLQDIEETLSLRPPHVSVYGMTIHEGTPFHEARRRRKIRLPDDDTQREMYLAARRALREAGYVHYEISNYALPGHESRHNRLYWNMAEYLGLGVSAHSYLAGRRHMNPNDLDTWLGRLRDNQLPAEDDEGVSLRSLRGERIMLSLRQTEGVSLSWLNAQLGCDFRVEYATEIEELTLSGLIETTEDKAHLTEEGMLLSDTVFLTFF
jgi:oxygen-independent coproporphyrinogen-3 oxidase